MNQRVNSRIVWAITRRDLRRYFNNPTGYVFVTLFVFLSAAAAFWRPRFFLNNLANLDQLSEVFPYILAFFVPALTMSVWADERKQGTDELLLTLPARDVDLVLGKYAAVLGVFTASLLLSLSHVIVLMWLGSPDLGLMSATYLGFWLAGAALIPVGMLASLATSNTTIAFILGSLFCAVPIGVADAAGTFNASLGRRLAPLAVSHHFRDFARGLIELPAVLYFVFLAGFFLYLNVVVLGQRHWPHDRASRYLWLHHLARAVALAVLLGSLTVMAMRAGARLDLTAERMHSLSAETRSLVAGLPADRPVVIQVYVSPDVPQMFVQPRENLLAVLRGIESLSGGKVTMVVEETEPYSPEAQRARERFGITPRSVADPYSGESIDNLYLGVALTSGPDEQVIPFVERGFSAEYEIARALRVVTRGSRKRIGVIDKDVNLFGGVDYATRRPQFPWAVVDELRKQYDVVELTPYGALQGEFDAMLVVLPSRLTVSEMELVTDRIKKGTPTLIVVDPLPTLDIALSPAAPVAAQINPYKKQESNVTVNYGNVRQMLVDLGVNWVPARIAWDSFNAHPDMTGLPPEAVFVSPRNGNPDALSRRHPATRGLQEVLMLYPGYLLAADENAFTFEPLLQTGTQSGAIGFFQATQPTPNGPVLATSQTHEADGRRYVLAAHVRPKTSSPVAKTGGQGSGDAPTPAGAPTNVIVIADLDFISDYFFEVRQAAPINARFDNVEFFLNSMDVLAGDESFIPLRDRRVRHRTLERVEAQTRRFVEQRAREEQQAEKDAQAALEDARARLKTRVQEIESRRDLDALARQIMTRNVQAAEERRLRVLESNIATEKEAKVQASRETMEAEIRRIRGTIRLIAVLLPPVPVVLLGLVIFARRTRREREGARAAGRLRND
ncbi:MAG TPA: Gldg family protein [Vicinamibacterales bacterium]|nr:Gldg family protein [Vicinamibacterales bacterium]